MKLMTEKQWYSSKQHFDTEMSYEEYRDRELERRAVAGERSPRSRTVTTKAKPKRKTKLQTKLKKLVGAVKKATTSSGQGSPMTTGGGSLMGNGNTGSPMTTGGGSLMGKSNGSPMVMGGGSLMKGSNRRPLKKKNIFDIL